MDILLGLEARAMPRALSVCSTIVAACQLQLAAAAPPTPEDAPITVPVAALAERVALDLQRDRARFVPEIIRRVYTPPAHRQPIVVPSAAPVVPGAFATLP